MGIKKLTFVFALLAMLGVAEAKAQVLSRTSESQVRSLLQRLETRTDSFRTVADRRLDNSNLDGTRAEDNITTLLNAFEGSTDELTRNFNSRTATLQNVNDVLTYGAYVDNFMRRARMGYQAENQWRLIRSDLDQLSRIYRINWNWNQTLPPFPADRWGGQYTPRVNATQFRNIIKRLETRTDNFRRVADRRIDNSRLDNTRAEDNITAYLEAFENATDELSRDFNGGNASMQDVNQVLTYGTYIDGFMRRRNMGTAAERQWTLVRADLDQLARLYRVSWNWNQTLPPFPMDRWGTAMPRVDAAQFRNIVGRIETRTDTFRRATDRRIDNSRLDGTQAEDNISAYLDAFENATDELRRNFNSGNATMANVNQVLTYGAYVDGFMRRRNMGTTSERQWTLIRSDLDQLAQLYRVSWNWNQTLPPFPMDRWGGGSVNSRLDGTYRLNVAMSDNINDVINRTISNTTVRERQRTNLTRRMTAPQTIAIETRGNVITMATDLGAQVTLTADGRAVTETNNRGRTTTTRVTMTGNSLRIETTGDRANDYVVTFTPIGGNRLRVTRTLYLENQNEIVTSNAVYDRMAEVANWPPVTNRPGWGDTPATTGEFLIPNGTRLTAVLRNRIATNVSYAGDPFTMEVTSPGQYSGAIIRGRLTTVERSGRVSGRANLAMEFDTIQYRGRTYSFAGLIDSAREADGDTISINNEGVVRDSNQTTRTITRAGIGAALGAIIGAIAGGGDGAAIGAAVGAGAGAGSVLIQGRDNLQLEQGTEFSITATGPTSVGYRY